MQEHFLKEIEIIDYKCFKDFNAKKFKRVNLISGKNNVGKTAFMEALNINVNSDKLETFIYHLASVKISRNNLEFREKTNQESFDFFKESLEEISCNIKSNIHKCSFSLKDINATKKFKIETNSNLYEVNINDFSYSIESSLNKKFIDNYGLSYSDIREVFIEIQKNEKEKLLDRYINEFDSSITSFKLLGDTPSCKLTDTQKYFELNEFGDGLSHYIGIICTLFACKDGFIFIDEIDNSIHYTQLEKLWEIIFTISKEVNCQVFATTHSKEMINAFAKVSKKLNDEDISFIELGRNKNNEIKSLTMNYEKLQRELESGNEIRGW